MMCGLDEGLEGNHEPRMYHNYKKRTSNARGENSQLKS
jgi:hypothetical protein